MAIIVPCCRREQGGSSPSAPFRSCASESEWRASERLFRGLGVGCASRRAVRAFPHGVDEGFMLPHLMRCSSARRAAAKTTPFLPPSSNAAGAGLGSLFRGLTGDRLLG